MKKCSVTVRSASLDDVRAYKLDIDQLPTLKAMIAEVDGKPIALFGLSRINGRWLAFCDLKEEARAYKLTIVRWGKRMMDDARAVGIRFVYADVDRSEPTSDRWLESMGFEPDPRGGPNLYRWRA